MKLNLPVLLLAAWNAAVFLIYGLDKLKAVKKRRRVPERTLLMLAFLLGGAGAMFGMVIFNHKTSKARFRYLVPIAAVMCLAVGYAFIMNLQFFKSIFLT